MYIIPNIKFEHSNLNGCYGDEHFYALLFAFSYLF